MSLPEQASECEENVRFQHILFSNYEVNVSKNETVSLSPDGERHERLLEACRRSDVAAVEEVLGEVGGQEEKRRLLNWKGGEALRAALPKGGKAYYDDELQETSEGVEVVRAILRAGGDANEKICFAGGGLCSSGPDQCTPLIFATYFGLTETARALLDKGRARTEERCKNWERTALGWTAWKKHDKVMRMLLDAGAEKNASDRLGRTALMWGAGTDNDKVVRMLVDAGADMEQVDVDGCTAVTLAAKRGLASVVALLANAGAKVFTEDKHGKSAVSHAMERERSDVLESLIAAGINWEGKEEKNEEEDLSHNPVDHVHLRNADVALWRLEKR